MNNIDKVKDMLREEKVPQELEPENIKAMLEAKAPAKKRSRIKMAGRITAGAAACAVICGTAVHFAGESDVFKKDKDVVNSEYEQMTKEGSTVAEFSENTPVLVEQAPYMSGASDYGEVYQLFRRSYDSYENNLLTETTEYEDAEEGGVVYESDEAAAPAAETNEDKSFTVSGNSPHTDGPEKEKAVFTPDENNESVNGPDDENEENEHSETYNQEEGVLEADIAKTDGKYIYYIYGNYDEGQIYLNAAEAEDGKFTYSEKISLGVSPEKIFGDGYINSNIEVSDMYLYNDTIAVIGSIYAYQNVEEDEAEYGFDGYKGYWGGINKNASFVSFYTTGEAPQLIDTYYQEGRYNDVRISPDGFMYLLTDYHTQDFTDIKEDDCTSYVPSRGMSAEFELIPAEDILMPADDIEEASSFSYTLIGSLDMNESGSASVADIKALAGYTGIVYSSADNIYTSVGWDDTDITRIAIEEGNITPAASGTVEGRAKDQFSFSEYNGYLRVATTKDSYTETSVPVYSDDIDVVDEVEPGYGYYSYERKRDNRLYVLDMDMAVVGSVTDFGLDEEIKSVNYSGDIAYVVTYEQTDPLFAIDISDPASPVILDEFKLPGYSTYMQKWEEGQLFGFGVNADENGIETGLKLNMFDNSVPDDLKLIDSYAIEGVYEEDEFIGYYSLGCYERKAIMIAPEKNLIGVQMCIEKGGYEIIDDENSDWNSQYETGYWFFSFEDGKFVLKGQYTEPSELRSITSTDLYQRAIYIGNYVYVLSGDKFIALSMDDFSVTDTAQF